MARTQARIGVLMGGTSAERSISLKTGQAIYESLLRRGYRAVRIDVDHSLPWQLRAKKVDIAFIALHGSCGEDGTVQGLLDVMGIPYTGSGVLASAITMDKAVTRVLLSSYGIPVPPGRILVPSQRGNPPPPPGLTWPLVVKPTAEGSTIGVSIVRRPSDWRAAVNRASKHGSTVLVESYIEGREMAVSVLESTPLPAVEVVAPSGFYDYAAKYQKMDTQYLCPAPLTATAAKQIGHLAVRSCEFLGCQGAARVDFRINRRGKPFVLEINSVPGMTERSLLPMAASQVGLSYDDLTEKILESASNRMRVLSRRTNKKSGAKKRR